MPTYADNAPTNTNVVGLNVMKSKAQALWACSIAFIAALAVIAPLSANAEVATVEDALSEMSIGSADAPVTLHEYSSLTCPHCASFHTGALPQIKKNFVDTGKVRIVFHDFPLDNLALAAVALARCAGPKRNVEFFDMLYQTQADWSRSEQPQAALTALARFYGLNQEDVVTCLSSETLIKTIQVNRDRDSDLYGIQSTPSFMLEGKKIEGALTYDDFEDLLNKALAKKGAN